MRPLVSYSSTNLTIRIFYSNYSLKAWGVENRARFSCGYRQRACYTMENGRFEGDCFVPLNG